MDAEIIVDGKRRRSWPRELKRRIVEESYAPEVPVCDVARRHDLDPAQLFAWRKLFRERSLPVASFLPVEVGERAPVPAKQEAAPEETTAERIEIALANGRHLFAPASIEPQLLSQLVAVLDHA